MSVLGDNTPKPPPDGPSYVAIRGLLAEAVEKLNYAAGSLIALGHYQDTRNLVDVIERLAAMRAYYRAHAEHETKEGEAKRAPADHH